MKDTTKSIEKLRHLSPAQRLQAVATATQLSAEQAAALHGDEALSLPTADGMIENVIGRFELPLGVATNFQVNGRDYLIPMAVEEPSVVAAASFMAKLIKKNGGFEATSTDPVMRGQIQLLNLPDINAAVDALEGAREQIVALANTHDKALQELGGGLS
jgi:hydroxymethylglutaryl-CoA reductase